MAEFIWLTDSIVNLSQIREIHFSGDTVAIHWQGGTQRVLTGADADLFLRGLEKRYNLMTDPAVRYFNLNEKEEAIA